jgi:hypothetical protein
MGLDLTRFQNVSRAQEQEPGEVFTLGSSNCPHRFSLSLIMSSMYRLDQHLSLYGSDRLSICSLGLRLVLDPPHHEPENSNSITLPSGESSYAVIDTGTTLVGGPAFQVMRRYPMLPRVLAIMEGIIFTVRRHISAVPVLC